jgi:hypothetical protein
MMMKTLSATLILAGCLCAGAAVAAPQDGLYAGTTSQGFPIEFTVSGGGTLVTSVSLTSEFTCSFGTQAVGFGFGVNQTITNDRWSLVRGFTPGVGFEQGDNFASLVNATFDTTTTASGTLSQFRAVFRGTGVQAETCRAQGATWTASLVGPLSAGDLDARVPMTITQHPVRPNAD